MGRESKNRVRSDSRDAAMSPTGTRTAVGFFGQNGPPSSGVAFNRVLKPSQKWNSSTRPGTVLNNGKRRSDTAGLDRGINRSSNHVGIEQIMEGRAKLNHGPSSANKLQTILGFVPEARVQSAHQKNSSMTNTRNSENQAFYSESLNAADMPKNQTLYGMFAP